ncbi:major facilitator superfamily protein [Natrinema pellirubrum DSM 15624]|uniref:Major facilitator superfamily protein n=1 Tax=Natrinema pellirubrum (strain DSM 15624 / CIP 106293 / JCM 10476 / NCIMB 786 / 157) TaxID=797303 RepID=L0JL31_NATP1|nr:MFS transporter [Natrinema pellirubrum]AGB31553.1 sugar phosphate permease [Natrinema pellirubrum DSM 15624]ELY73343.1 major facilitator superfamily protein [Natrinema pellirubrum DSM 15624]
MTLNDNDRSIAAFAMLAHATVHWFELAIPIFLVVWLEAFDISIAVAGIAVAAGYALFGIGALPAGLLADRYGPKRLVLACLVGMSVSFVGLSLATSIYGIAAALVCWGVTASVYHPAGLALISTGVEDRGTVFAWHGIAGNLGIALGPFATATLLLVLDWRLVAVVLSIPGAVATLYGLRARFDPTAAVADDGESTGSRSVAEFVATSRSLLTGSFLLVFAVVTVVGLYYRGVLTYLPELLNGLPALAGIEPPAALEELSLGDYFYVALLVAGMAGQYVAGKLTSRVPVARGLAVVFVGLAVLAVAFVPVSGLGLLPILLYCGVLGFALFAIEPFYQEAVAVYTPPDARGLSYGYTYLGMFGLGSLSIALGGYLLDHATTAALFVTLAAIALLGAGIAARLLFSPTPVASESPDAADASAGDD